MKILIVGVDYAPDQIGIAPYTTGLAQHLAGVGHDVTVVTTFPHYPTYRWTHGRRLFSSETIEGVRVLRVWCLLPRRGTVSRIVFDTSFAVAALLVALPRRRPDVVVGVCVPAQTPVVAGFLAKLRRSRSVMLVQDLPVEAAVAVGMLRPGSFAHRVGNAVQQAAFRLANRIVVINGRFGRRLVESGVEPGKIVEIANWVRLQPVPKNVDGSVRAELGCGQSDFLAVHTGNMGEKQDLGKVVAAAALLGEDFRIAIVGDGSTREALERTIAESKSRVLILGLQSVERHQQILAGADALLLTQRADVLDSVAPSKLVAYMAAGRPVVAAVHPASVGGELVRESDCGLIVDAGDPEALAAALRRLRADPELAKRLGENGARFAVEHFDAARLLKRWERLVEDIALEQHSRGSTPSA